MKSYVRVAVDTGSTSQIESLTYELPDGLAGTVGVGSCVLVPLGSRQAVGYVIGFESEPDVPNIRPIISLTDSPVRLTEEMLGLARWMSEQYLCPLSHAVISMLPGVMHCRIQDRVSPVDPAPDSSTLTPSEKRVWDALLDRSGAAPSRYLAGTEARPLREVGDRSSVQRVLRQLESKGFIRRTFLLAPPEGKPRIMRGVRLVREGEACPERSRRAPAEPMALTAKQREAVEIISGLARDVSIVELSQRHGVSRRVIEGLAS